MTAESPRRHAPRIAAATFASASFSLAPLYVLLASNEASFTTGQVFGATGGEVGP